MESKPQLKPLVWVATSWEDLKEFPDEVQRSMGYALYLAQAGKKHLDAKPLKGFGGAGVLEVVDDFDGNAFRAVYTVKLAGVVYVLHAFPEEVEEGRENIAGRHRQGEGQIQRGPGDPRQVGSRGQREEGGVR